MEKKLRQLEQRLAVLPDAAVAFSGGTDSAFLVAVAKQVHPKSMIAITVSSQFVPAREIEAAAKIARLLGVKQICLTVDIFENEAVVRNPRERCYHCKKQMFSRIKTMAESLGFCSLLHAVNLDDLKECRPGLKAAAQLGFLSPLVDAQLTKKDIRLMSKQRGLETWDKPSQSCLATRIPYHERITADRLDMIDRAESFLQDLGIDRVRVRCHGPVARIEIDPDRIDAFFSTDLRQKISIAFVDIGFEHTAIDIDGYGAGK